MTVVASQELGPLGSAQSARTPFIWRWYYHVPNLPLWGLILGLLILLRSNHSWQAWLILLPLLLLMLAWRMFVTLLSLAPSAAEPFGNVLFALAAAWGIVWLLGRWLAARHGAIAFLSVFALLLVVGGMSYLSAHGTGSGEDLAIWSMLYGVGSVALLIAMTISGWLCGKKYRPGRFMAWLLLWIVVVPTLCFPVVVLAIVLFESGGLAEAVSQLVMALIGSLVAGGVIGSIVYALNLPFMFLAIRCPLYRDRFCDVFRMSTSPFAATVAGIS